MPYQVIFLDKQQGVLVRRWGELAEREYRAAMDELTCDPERLRGLRYLMVDYSEADTSYLKAKHVGQVALDTRDIIEQNPDLLFVGISRNFFLRTMARLWQALHEDLQVRSTMVGSLEQAKQWVNNQSQQTFLFQAESANADSAQSSSA